MNILPTPQVDDVRLLERLHDHFLGKDGSVHAANISRHSGELQQRYGSYVDNLDREGPYTQMGMGTEQADSMRAAYRVVRRAAAFSDVRHAFAASKASITGYCPFCGVSTADTFDHFAPKDGVSGFPEFAVYSGNLVPMCGECNRRKGSLSGPSPRAVPFPHAYYDTADYAGMRLIAEVRCGASSPYIRFSLEFTEGISRIAQDRFIAACNRLDLFDRWSFVAQGEMETVAIEFQALARAQDIDLIQQSLARRASSTRVRLGRNSWRAAVYEALGASPQFWRGPYTRLCATEL